MGGLSSGLPGDTTGSLAGFAGGEPGDCTINPAGGAAIRPGFAALAEALRYPGPTSLHTLRTRAAALASGPAAAGLAAFVEAVAPLDLGAWEELYARTFDFSPATSLYVGYQVWGEHYRRGELMVELARALTDAGVDRQGELPDHLIPVLRLLTVTEGPPAALLDTLIPALEKIQSALRAADPRDPYLPVIAAAEAEAAALARAYAPDPESERRRS